MIDVLPEPPGMIAKHFVERMRWLSPFQAVVAAGVGSGPYRAAGAARIAARGHSTGRRRNARRGFDAGERDGAKA